MSLAIDPWADQSIDEPVHQPPLTPDECDAIEAEIRERQFANHALIPGCHAIGFDALCELGKQGNHAATQAVRQMLRLARFGGPLDEPQEPSWA